MERYYANPRYGLPEWAYDMLRLWRQYQGGGMGGSGHMPELVMEQPAIMVEAFDIMSSAEAELKPDKT